MKKTICVLAICGGFVLLTYTAAFAGGVKQLREENKELKSQLDSAVLRIGETESRLQSLQIQLGEKDRQLDLLRTDLEALDGKLKELEDLMKKEGSQLLQEVMDLRERRLRLEEQAEMLGNDLAVTNKEVERLDLVVSDYQKELQKRNDEIGALEKTAEELSRTLDARSEEYSREISRLNDDKRKLELETEKLKTAVAEGRKALAEQIDTASSKLSDTSAKNDALRAEVSALNGALAQQKADQSRKMEAMGTEMEGLRGQIAHLETENSELRGRNADLDRELKLKLAAEEASKEQMKKTYDQLITSLRKEVGEKTVEVQRFENALTINIVEKIFFDSGKAAIKPEGLDVLRRVGAIIKDLPDKMIRIEGHTDDVPIGPKLVSVYPNNWELGAARASNVAEYFRTKSGISPDKLVVVSYSMYKPIVPNTSEENRAKNRRIEIILQDKSLYEMIRAEETERS